jgi:hypothetical protein
MADETPTPETGAQETETTTTETPPEPEVTPSAKPDDLPDAVKEILKKERKAAADAEKARKQAEAKVKEFEDRDKSESEKLAEKLSGTEKERDDALTKLARFEVAAEKKLPAELAELLTGSKEEMEARADVLLQHVNAQQTPDFGQGAREQVAEQQTPEQAHNALILGLTGHLPQNQ